MTEKEKKRKKESNFIPKYNKANPNPKNLAKGSFKTFGSLSINVSKIVEVISGWQLATNTCPRARAVKDESSIPNPVFPTIGKRISKTSSLIEPAYARPNPIIAEFLITSFGSLTKSDNRAKAGSTSLRTPAVTKPNARRAPDFFVFFF